MRIVFFDKFLLKQQKKKFIEYLKMQPDPVAGSKQNFSHALLERIFEKILAGEMPVIQMTRSCDLQDKLVELFPELGPPAY